MKKRGREQPNTDDGNSPPEAARLRQSRAALQRSLRCQRAGKLEAAERHCRDALTIHPSNPDALHILGLIKSALGDLSGSEELMRRSLSLAPGQPHVLNNLGNILRGRGMSAEAIQCYRQASELLPDYADAWFNLGLALDEAGEPESALVPFRRAITLRPEDAKARNALGLALKELDRLDEAMACFRDAISLHPGNFRALHNLGVALKMAERPGEALEFYDQALKIDETVPELHYNIANALYEVGRIDDAISSYGKALDLKPDYLEAHETLNKLHWQHGQTKRYLTSYPAAIVSAPDSLEIRIEYANWLLLAGRDTEAEAVMRQGLRDLGHHAPLYWSLARALANQARIPEALDSFAAAVRGDPRNGQFRLDFSRLLIIMEQYEKALDVLEPFNGIAPFDQQYIAYKGLCWRFLGDAREPVLNDYDRFVKPYRLKVPDGYENIQAFNGALNRTLDRYHRTQIHPAEQTLRGGTQTQGSLFAKRDKVIAELRGSIEIAVRQYIDQMDDDADHPLLCRKSRNFRFAGSWSCRLRGDGFHVNHVHSEGWISSSYYVSLPDVVARGEGPEGWIKFGETSLNLGDREQIRKVVRPEEGLLVLFPSYIYHGTFPFASDQTRTTTPFDVVPVT